MGYDEWKAEQDEKEGETHWWDYIVPFAAPGLEGIANLFGRSFMPPEMQESPLGQTVQAWNLPKVLTGGMESTFSTIGSITSAPGRYREDWTQALKPWEYLPGGAEYESYEQLPWWQQLIYESPAMLFTGGTGATSALPKAGKTLLAERGMFGIKAPPSQAFTAAKLKPGRAGAEALGERATFREITGRKAPATNPQKIKIHALAREKNLMYETGKMRPQYRRLAKAMTGKTSAAKMTSEEASIFIEALDRVVVRGVGKAPKIPVTTDVITKEFADKIPMLREIGALERVRPSRQVFEKIGLRKEVWEPAFESELAFYQEAQVFKQELAQIQKLVRAESRPAIFRALENPAKATELVGNDKVAYDWFKKYFDDWADRLKLPAEKRRKNYVTHIFEEAIKQDLAAKHPLDPEIIRAMDFASPKTVFNPFLQKRLGQTTGLIEDPFVAASAYESRALRTFHYQPLLQRIRVYEKYTPPNATRYLRDFTTRLTNRPLPIDREINQTLKEFGEAIRGLPYGEKLAAQLTRGNAGGLAAYNYTSMLYFLWLGFKPTSAIRNLSQHFLALADIGPINLARGIALRATKEGQAALKQSRVLASRQQAYMPGIDTSFASRWADKVRETSLKMFRWADKQNVSDSFLAGYYEAKQLGLPEKWCIRRGDEVASNTQYLYTRLAGAQWSQNTLGRVLSPLTTWPENWLELVTKWIKNRPSYVYREYAAATGKTVAPMEWSTKYKSLLLYLTLVGAAYATQYKTPFRASEYTGWTSIRYLQDIAAGELPGLEFPRAFAEIIGGALTGDTSTMKTGWGRIRPDKMLGIVRQFQRIADGKADWLSLFIYMNPEKEGDKWPSEFPGLPELDLPKLPTFR